MTDRNPRDPTPWNDLVAQWKEKAAATAEPGAQHRIWEQIVTRLDTPPEGELDAVKPTSHRKKIAWAVGTGIALGIFVALMLLELGVVP